MCTFYLQRIQTRICDEFGYFLIHKIITIINKDGLRFKNNFGVHILGHRKDR